MRAAQHDDDIYIYIYISIFSASLHLYTREREREGVRKKVREREKERERSKDYIKTELTILGDCQFLLRAISHQVPLTLCLYYSNLDLHLLSSDIEHSLFIELSNYIINIYIYIYIWCGSKIWNNFLNIFFHLISPIFFFKCDKC